MKIEYIKDGNGNTVAVQIPWAEYQKVEPLLRLVENQESDLHEDSELPEKGTNLSDLFSLHDPEKEASLPDLKKYYKEDREDRV